LDLDAMRFPAAILTLFYLAGPLLIISELFTPGLAIPILLLSLAFIMGQASLLGDHAAYASGWRASDLVAGFASFALCVTWIYYSGIGSFAICRWDYVKHNLIFSYLLDQKLPIHTTVYGNDVIVHYGFAYYITPVRLYQVAHALAPGITLNGVLLTIYSMALFLATSILSRGRMPFLLALLAILCLTGGLDLLGMLKFGSLSRVEVSAFWIPLPDPLDLERWGIPYAPPSLTMSLYYAPQHFFGALIGSALIYALLQSNQPAAVTLMQTIIIIAASVFWSPYVTVGLAALAILLVLCLNTHGTILMRIRQEGIAVAPTLLISFAFAAVLVIAASLFLLASKPLSSPQLIFRQDNALDWLLTYALNYAVYLFALTLLLLPLCRKVSIADADEEVCCSALPKVIAGGLVASAAVVALHHGFYNDWGLRVTLPLSIALAVALTKAVFSGLKWPYVVALLTALAVSSASSLSAFAQSMLLPANCKPYGAFRLEEMRGLGQQYEGRTDSFLYQYLVRP
jgi:hypothetical protein